MANKGSTGGSLGARETSPAWRRRQRKKAEGFDRYFASMCGPVRSSNDKDAEIATKRNTTLRASGDLLTCPHCGYTVAKASGEKTCPHCRRGTYGNRFKVKKR